jgi:hypothetical protein
MIMALISGTRLVGGTDFIVYLAQYKNVPTFPDVLLLDRHEMKFEYGYVYITSFFKTIGISFFGFCLIHAMVFYACLWKGLKRYTNHFGLVIFVFLYKLFFYNTMISMRQSLTVALFLLIIPYIEQRKWIKYYICAFLIAKIHNGAYLFLVLYPLTYFVLTKGRIRFLNIIFIPTIFIGLLGIDATSDEMAQKAQGYFNNENLSPIGIFHTLEYFLIMFILYNNLDKLNLNDKKVHLVIMLFLCLLPLFTLFRGSEILTREKDYFTIFYAVILGYIIDRCPRSKTLYYLGTFLLCAFGYYRYVILFDNGAFLRYKSWLLDPQFSFFLN